MASIFNLLANSNKTFSKKMDQFFTAVLKPLVINLTGLFYLCVVTIHLPSSGDRGKDKRFPVVV